jgi:aspartyl/glutamyl-tRNA(Asn/Gln) amidotransferase C subunit
MNPDYIDQEIFNHLVELSQLNLDPQEAEYLRTELNHQLTALKELLQVPLDEDIQPSTWGLVPQGTGMRPDEAIPDAHPQAIVALAPETEDGYIAVPDLKEAA